jgi:hypothetical protein
VTSWFAVDKAGLAKLLEKRGKSFAIFELVQNAWDTDTGEVRIMLKKLAGKPAAMLIVEDDDPNGFADLAHSYTLFAESVKKNDPTKRGRFNLGEKLVLALCQHAEVASTKGTVIFKADGSREKNRTKTTQGSVFSATIRMNQAEYDEVCDEIHKLIPPVHTIFNGETILQRMPIAEFEASLPTIKADDEGNLARTTRKTVVKVYEPRSGEVASIYEMGIPVVETNDAYHLDVQQKVPVNLDRDNVPPSYLRKLRALVLNETFDKLDPDDAKSTWVSDALAHEDVEADAVDYTMTQRFGKKRAIYDPSDVEANNRLAAEGYAIVHGGSLSKEAWGNVKRFNAAAPAGALRPTPKPYSEDPDADPVDIVPKDKWTRGMIEVAALIQRLGVELLDRDVTVTVVNTSNGFVACYGRDTASMDLNLRRLGHLWFRHWRVRLPAVLDLIIHEFAHHHESNHLSEGYYNALSKLGGQMTELALRKPELFEDL